MRRLMSAARFLFGLVIDKEPNGDELDGSGAEDDFVDHSYSFRAEPGCPISDPDMAVDDQGCDDINDDREEESDLMPDWGMDQTAGMLPFHPGVDPATLSGSSGLYPCDTLRQQAHCMG